MAEGLQVVDGVLLLEAGGLTLFSHGLEEAGMDPMLLGGFVQSLHEFSENAIGDRGLKTVIFRQKKMRMLEVLSDKQLVLVTSADILDEPLDNILERFKREIKEDKLIQEEFEEYKSSGIPDFPQFELKIQSLCRELNHPQNLAVDTPVHVLQVDNDVIQHELLKTILSGYFPSFEIDTASTIHEMDDKIKNGTYDLMIVDLTVLGDDSLSSLLQIKTEYPEMDIVVASGQKDVRNAVEITASGIPYITKGEHFVPDMFRSLRHISRQVLIREQRRSIANLMMDESNFPLVVFRMEGASGFDVIFRDFEEFPEPLNQPVEAFLQFLGMFTFSAVGQGSMYHRGAFVLPALSSKSYQALVYSFQIHDEDSPSPDDASRNIRYIQFVLFIPKRITPILPNVQTLDDLFHAELSKISTVEDVSDSSLLKQIKIEVLLSIASSLRSF